MPNANDGRRTFLRQTAAAAAGSALWSQSADAKPAKVRLDADVIVIGAGMAGVAAAAHLHPHRRVIVLEGRPDRIGGRIWTSHKWSDEPVDLGASWLTHEQVNPLKQIAIQAGIRLIPSQLTNLALFQDGHRILAPSTLDGLEEMFVGIVADMKLLGAQRQALGLPDIPASQAYATALSKRSLDPDTLRKMNYFADHVFQEAQAAPLSALSTFELGEDGVTAQGLTTASIIPEGYLQLVNLFAQGLDIRLGHVVDTIAYGKNGVAVVLEDGRTLRAKYAIVTLPLGVLKSRCVTFIPDLPKWKMASIDRLGFGSTEKIYFRFPHAFWPDTVSVDRVAETLEGRWSAWFNFQKYTIGPNGEPGKATLLSFNHAPYGTQLEQMSDAQVMDAAYAALKNQYGDKALRPIAMQRSHWATDRFARGVIPNKPPGATDLDFRRVGAPVAKRLFFAGDSTTDLFFGFVLGAFQTGIREATRILHMPK